MQFEELRLIQPLLDAIETEGYNEPSPIQAQAIPHVLEGNDLLGCAQTGTGKTAAFSLPMLQRLHESTPKQTKGKRPIRGLILSPTRELAAQIADNLRNYGRNVDLKHTVIYGGVNQYRQVQALRKGVDILVATPGRLLDLMNQKHVNLQQIECFVLDEADRMLDMGFINDIRKVIATLPKKRQNLLFSATMPKEIRTLADTILKNPVTVKTAVKESALADTVEHSVCFVDSTDKTSLLLHILENPTVTKALVFTRTKRRADRVTKSLSRERVRSDAIHADKSQSARLRALADFKKGKTRVLVASDLAARGVDVDDISHVFNYDLPGDGETYVHRVGRTGRAGNQGRAVSFCGEDEHQGLRVIEKLLDGKLPVDEHPFKATQQPIAPAKPKPRRNRRPNRGPQMGPKGQQRKRRAGPRKPSKVRKP